MALWTPITSELPDADITVLIYNSEWDDDTQMGYLSDEAWYTVNGRQLDGQNPYDYSPNPRWAPPTHWMPFPEPPSPRQRVQVNLTETEAGGVTVEIEFAPLIDMDGPMTPTLDATNAIVTALAKEARGEGGK